MPNDLENAIAAHRRALLQLDREALARVLAQYQQTVERLKPTIELLVQAIEQGGTLTPAQVFRLQRYQELQRQIDDEMRRLVSLTESTVADGQNQAIQMAIGHAQDASIAAAATQAGEAVISGSWVRVPTSAIEDFLGATRQGPLANLFSSFGDVTASVLTNEITNAMAMGFSPRKVADAISGATDIARNRALTITRTEMLRAYRGASLQSFNANDDILDGWTWACAHQTRTCGACLAMDGSFHPLSETMPSHPNCRCTQIPHLKGEPMNSYTTGEEWLSKQSPEAQNKVLGIEGGNAYRSGEVKLHDFVRTHESKEWGPSKTNGGVGWARKNAQERNRRAGIHVPDAPQRSTRTARPTQPKPKPTVPRTDVHPKQSTESAVDRAKREEATRQQEVAHREAVREQAVRRKETEIQHNTSESAHFYDANGKLVFSKGGDHTSVGFTEDELGHMKDTVAIHNHPSAESAENRGRGFSREDLSIAVRSDVAEERVITSDGVRLSLKRPATGWGAHYTDVDAAWEQAQTEVLADYRKRALAKELTREDAAREMLVDINRKVADRYGWEFTIEDVP